MRGARARLAWIVTAATLSAALGVALAQAQTGGTGNPVIGVGDQSAPPTPGVERPPTTSAPGLTEEITEGLKPRGAGLTLAGPVDPNVYRVGPGDVLQLILWGKVSKTLALDVGPEGHIILPGVGVVQVAGRTLSDVETLVVSMMRQQFFGVNMRLRLVQPRSFRVFLTGQVHDIGPLVVNGTYRLADALQPKLILDVGSRRRIEIIHRDSTREIADLERFVRLGDMSGNPALRDGDVIDVPVATDFIYAAGAVANPGRVELGLSDSLLTLLRLAGDPLPSADADRALLVRFTKPFQPESLWFGLADVYSNQVNPPMRDGDRVYIYYIPQYHLQHEATVMGEVARPGVYPIVEGRHHLSDLMASAGGFLPGADLSSIRINRRSPNTAEKDPELDRLLRLSRNELTNTEFEVMRTKLADLKEDFRVDWNRLVADKANLDLILRDGDVIRVERLVRSIRVDGEVKRPGILVYEPGLGVDDYVRQAGGYTDRAWKKRVRVTRSVTGQTMLAKGVETLDPGDLIYVPEKRDSNWGQNAQTFLLFAAQIATIVLAVVTIRHI